MNDLHFHNATLPRAILTVPADRFGRERIRATVENRYRHTDFAPAHGELPVKPSRASLFGGAPKGIQPPRDIVSRPVVSTRVPRERAQRLPDAAPRERSQAVPQSRYIIPPVRREGDERAPTRPPFGVEVGPERAPPPLPPRYSEVKRSTPAAVPVTPRSKGAERDAVRSQDMTHEQRSERREVPPVPRPAVAAPSTGSQPAAGSAQPPRQRAAPVPQRGEGQRDDTDKVLPGQPANQTYRGRGRENRDVREQ